MNLDNNLISSIDAGVLSPMTSLRKVKYPCVFVFFNLKHRFWYNFNSIYLNFQFSAKGNQLTAVPAGLFVDHSTLQEIDLQDNQITAISNDLFSVLPEISVTISFSLPIISNNYSHFILSSDIVKIRFPVFLGKL